MSVERGEVFEKWHSLGVRGTRVVVVGRGWWVRGVGMWEGDCGPTAA